MLLVDGLARHPKGFGDLGPGPPIPHRALNLGILKAISHGTKGRGGSETVGGATKWGGHEATLVAKFSDVNLGC